MSMLQYQVYNEVEIKGCIFDKHPISHPDQRGVNNEQTLTKAQE